jgi:hypothetical protein
MHMKKVLQRAPDIRHQTLTEFVLGSAYDRAMTTLPVRVATAGPRHENRLGRWNLLPHVLDAEPPGGPCHRQSRGARAGCGKRGERPGSPIAGRSRRVRQARRTARLANRGALAPGAASAKVTDEDRAAIERLTAEQAQIER